MAKDTAKPIKAAIQAAHEQNAVLFLYEADSLLSKRVSTGESYSTSINQNRNCLMQELDRFDGLVIVTTNLFENYDPALLRRIQRHIKFRVPDASIRRELFALHLPNPERVRADYAVLGAFHRPERRRHPEHLPESQLRGKHEPISGAVDGHAGDN